MTFIPRLFLFPQAPCSVADMSSTPALDVRDIVMRRDGVTILDGISLRVDPDQRWIILGANGSGKTSLMRVMALQAHPTAGVVEVLGERLGHTDVRELRQRVGYTSAALTDQLRSDLIAHDVVRTARFGALEPWWHRYSTLDDERADECLRRLGVERHRDRRFGSLSSGEQQRVLLARAVMNDPAIVLLDEPSARLDLGGREDLVATLSEMALDTNGPPFVMVTHHVDEIPTGVTHVAMLSAGRLLRSGPIDDTLDSDSLSECFGTPLVLERRDDGRFSAWGRRT